MYFAGIDIAKKQHEARIVHDKETPVLSRYFQNTYSGVVRVLRSVRKLKTLSRTRLAFTDQMSALKQHGIGVPDRVAPEYASCFSNEFHQASPELLENQPTLDDIAELDLSELTEFLELHCKERVSLSSLRH